METEKSGLNIEIFLLCAVKRFKNCNTKLDYRMQNFCTGLSFCWLLPYALQPFFFLSLAKITCIQLQNGSAHIYNVPRACNRSNIE